jgi:ribosome-associated toxin RatA of RatAB toxin-antitoxin module
MQNVWHCDNRGVRCCMIAMCIHYGFGATGLELSMGRAFGVITGHDVCTLQVSMHL